MTLTNKTILITGSTAGIGAAIARECIKQGANVMLQGRCAERAQAMVNELGPKAKFVIADLDDESAYEHIINATIAAFGSLHGLINNAGIYPRHTIETANTKDFDHIFDINVKAPLMLSKYAINYFKKQQYGNIVNIGSINAYCGQNDLLIYSMSKGALMTMTRNLAESLASDNIRVNQLNVGWTLTENEEITKLKEGLPADWQSKLSKLFAPRGKIYKPEEVAPHAVFWVSDLSAPSSGQVYEVEQYTVIGRNHINRLTFYQETQQETQ